MSEFDSDEFNRAELAKCARDRAALRAKIAEMEDYAKLGTRNALRELDKAYAEHDSLKSENAGLKARVRALEEKVRTAYEMARNCRCDGWGGMCGCGQRIEEELCDAPGSHEHEYTANFGNTCRLCRASKPDDARAVLGREK